YSYPAFKLRATYRLPGVGYQAACDGKQGRLYVAVFDPKALTARPRGKGVGALHVFELKPLLTTRGNGPLPNEDIPPPTAIDLSPEGGWPILDFLVVRAPTMAHTECHAIRAPAPRARHGSSATLRRHPRRAETPARTTGTRLVDQPHRLVP